MNKEDKLIKAIDGGELFIADFLDAAPKGEMESMEHPIFSLSKKPDLEIFRYHNEKQGIWIEVAPSLYGRANILDKDLLLYCTGQLLEGMNRGEVPKRTVRITAYDYLTQTRRNTSGREYKQIHESLARLRGTTFKTNLHGEGGREVFGLIDEAEIITDQSGRLTYIDITLSRRVFEAIKNKRILTYSREYFGLSPSERRTYEIVRKHCGKKAKWEVGLETFYRKFGSRASSKEFRRTVRNVVTTNRIPDYNIEFDTARNVLIARFMGKKQAA